MACTRLLALAFIFGVTACGSTDGTAPAPAAPVTPADSATQPVPTRTIMSLASPDVIVGLPGEAVGYPPSIRVTAGRPDGTPVAGLTVSFTFSDGRGSRYSTITDPKGRATLADMQIDNAPGEYDITATVEGVGSLTFAVRSLSGHVTATYDLVSMDGYSLPVDLRNSVLAWSVIGGHYQLFDDGTYRRGYQLQGKAGLYDRTGEIDWEMPGVFITRLSGQIEFYSDSPPASPSGVPTTPLFLLSVGTFSGEKLTMAYRDITRFPFDEEYVRGY